ncbi:STAS/SEC14 domain-containing protein [Sinomicrobium weinanense]|uniref:STAS/SEC14 domain-containing protein n=1 Tax=Sinomicrobium weinanense TaxID=2842200 RepID=A0A926Q5Q3_9FLAO|nr:STAS/SEC14 domain-containing protein [Sinomicrobium weinanense]MBC9798401.1 STAS/SEC14 domain-containing protein [Sinomicrobium weinanense]MBU3122584.1 STAS/SEC14 domain-containing protein [Sinomicrobium weinanense]
MPKRVKLDFGILEFHENFVISELDEGIHFVSEQNKVLISACLKHFKDKPFGYISNRIYSYSVDPFIYVETEHIENFVAMAVVVSTSAQKLSSRVEKMFCKRPFRYFYNLEEARAWIENTINTGIASGQHPFTRPPGI